MAEIYTMKGSKVPEDNQVIVTYGDANHAPVIKGFDTVDEAYAYYKEAVEALYKAEFEFPCMVTRNRWGSMMSCEIIESKGRR